MTVCFSLLVVVVNALRRVLESVVNSQSFPYFSIYQCCKLVEFSMLVDAPYYFIEESVMIKQRYWMFVCYPESMSADAFEKLHSLMLPLAISPLHEYDVDESTGELKKPHYHILICYPGPTTYKAVCDNVCPILNVSTCKPCISLKSSYEYLFHKNEKDKHLYNEADIKFFHGLSAKEVDRLNFESTLFSQMIQLIDNENPRNFHQLVRLISKTNNMDMIHYLMSYSFFWKNYIDH